MSTIFDCRVSITNFEWVKSVQQREKDTVSGYLRNAQRLLSTDDHDSYYNIPTLIVYICLAFYHIYDEFDSDIKSKHVEVTDNNTTIIHRDNCLESTTFLKRVTELTGVFHWKFVVKNCVKQCNDSWGHIIGIWKCEQGQDQNPNGVFTHNSCGYGFAYGFGHKLSQHGGNLGDKYAVKCVTGDIIDMYCDLDKLELRFAVNNIDYGVAFEIEKLRYKAAVTTYYVNDSIKVI